MSPPQYVLKTQDRTISDEHPYYRRINVANNFMTHTTHTPIRRIGGLFFAALALAAVAVATPSSPAAGGADDEGVRLLGRWRPSRLGPNDQFPRIRIASGPRIAYVLSSGMVAAYDLDSLEPFAGEFALGDISPVTTVFEPSGLLVAATHVAGLPRISAFSVLDGQLQKLGQWDVSTSLAGATKVAGLQQDDAQHLYVLAASPNGVGGLIPGSLVAAKLDGSHLASGRLHPSWAFAVPQCHLPMTFNVPAGIGYAPAQNAVYFGCTDPQAFLAKPPVASGVGRLALNAAGAPDHFELLPLYGDYSAAGDSLFDPASGRLLMVNQSSGAGVTVVGFDTPTNAFIGAIGASNNQLSSLGLDRTIGRLYALTPNPANGGLVVSDIRTTPLAQGSSFVKFASLDEKQPELRVEMGIDTLKRRLFVRYSGTDDFVILQDDLAPYVPPPLDDPDVNTEDVPEISGQTQARVGAEAQGFGARIRLVGGTDSLQFNLVPVDGPARTVPLGSGTRELRSSWLERLTMSNNEAAAHAIAADRDSANTAKDQTFGNQLRDQGPPSSNPPDFSMAWPFTPAQCVDLGEGAYQHSESGATVACDADKRTASATASFAAAGDDIAVGATDAASELKVTSAGTVATVTATARSVSVLGGRLQIARVTSVATSTAHGRRGSASSDRQVVLDGVVLDGRSLCTQQCDPRAVADQVNLALNGLARIDFPQPERSVLASAGGYQAWIRRNLAEQVQAVKLNDQAPDRIEVPGAVITLFSDNTRPSRTVIELAGVETQAQYGISRLVAADFGTTTSSESDGPGDLLGALSLQAFGSQQPTSLSGEPLVASRGNDDDGPAPLERFLPAVLRPAWRLMWKSLREAGPLVAIWLLLLSPVFVAGRRWLLLKRGSLHVEV